ncbi:ComEC/Rec2 family competence protein [Corynebacterium afermentans]|uniref:ComEC/Rec2 family competence protein n=1 Tax=Corynebacterium afermentans TaxID=38286 RepID=UPI002573C7A3|nr:ComEC/Rec2 family competence protein [Corynebacterium afermentans]MCG7274855.1 ComEC/Rec2 family competence protein [Corynebacterium afermentans]
MSELRLVPAALAVWAAAACCILFGVWAALLVAGVLAVCCLAGREPGQAVLTAGLGAAGALTAAVRTRASAPASEFAGTISGTPKQTDTGAYLVRVRVPGKPSTTPVFADELPDGAVAGAQVVSRGVSKESGVPGVNPFLLDGHVEVLGPPEGLAAFAHHVRSTFAAAVEAQVGEGARGLIPGMVLGDVSLQPATEQQMYIDTGLSHLSAVSGANIAIVATFATVAAAAIGAGLRGRIAASAVALLVYAALVGPEPSVLRASVSGLVGLVAVLASRQAEPIHALCLSVVGLVLVDSDLAVHYGFALSVAATAGIVALYPLLYRALAVTVWPDILVRALAVAVAADLATMPIVALMAGRVSLVSVGANVLVAPVVGPVTVLGLVAAVCSLLPGGLEVPVLWCVEPLAWWVHTVARVGAGLPSATVSATPLTALVAYGWVVAGFLAGRPRATVCAAAACVIVAAAMNQPAAPVDYTGLRAYVVDTAEEAEPVPQWAQLVVVLESGPPKKRPVATRDGIPVIFPNRKGT